MANMTIFTGLTNEILTIMCDKCLEGFCNHPYWCWIDRQLNLSNHNYTGSPIQYYNIDNTGNHLCWDSRPPMEQIEGTTKFLETKWYKS
jgi:hypothetical protein